MINAWFTFWPAKYVRNNIQGKQFIDLDYDGTTIKKAMGNSYRGEEIKQKCLHEHFLSDSHQSFEEVVGICLIDKTDPSDPDKREYYWMRTLKAITSFGLNTEERYWAVHTITCFTSVLPDYIIA